MSCYIWSFTTRSCLTSSRPPLRILVITDHGKLNIERAEHHIHRKCLHKSQQSCRIMLIPTPTSSSLSPSCHKIPSVPQNQSNRYASVRQYAWHAGIVSALDTFTAGELPETARLDTTQPQICDKARRQYVEGMQLMQVDEHPDYFTTGMEMVARAVHLLSATTSHQLDDGRLLDIAIEARSAGYGNGQLERHHFAVFDAISAPAESALSTGPGLLQSAFDGPLAPVAVDLAPYVRSIVQYDLALEEQRERLSRLLENSDGQKNKRARTTRAARSALEGSQRASTRRERWFTKILDLQGVLSTGGTEWPKCPFAALDDGSVEGSREDQSED